MVLTTQPTSLVGDPVCSFLQPREDSQIVLHASVGMHNYTVVQVLVLKRCMNGIELGGRYPVSSITIVM